MLAHNLIAHNHKVDFILKVSPYTISVITANNFIISKSIAQQNLKSVIQETMLEIENLQLRRLKQCILLFDFGMLNCKKIKINHNEKLTNLSLIQAKLEGEMNYKVFSNFTEYNSEYKMLNSLALKKENIEYITGIVCDLGIEIIEAKPDFLFDITQVSCNNFVFAKFSPHHFEFSYVEEGKVKSYSTTEKFGINNIFAELSTIFNKPVQDLRKITSSYSFLSLAERLKIYYSKEKEDLQIKDLIESNKFIALFNIELKRIMLKVKSYILENKSKDTPLVFNYEESYRDCRIHKSLMDENIMSFEHSNYQIDFKEEKEKFVAIFTYGMKKIFNLSS